MYPGGEMTMNRLFKVVWSKTKGMFIVVSEIAGSWQKGKVKAHVMRPSMAALLCAALLVGCPMGGLAADVATADHATTADTAETAKTAEKAEKLDYVNVNGSGGTNTADTSGAVGSKSIAIGQDARADGPNGIAIGNGAETRSRGSDKLSNGTNSITIGSAKTAGSEVLSIGTIKYINSLYGRVNADGTIDDSKPVTVVNEPVPFQDKVILVGYDNAFDANNKSLLKRDNDTFLRYSAVIGHENTIKANTASNGTSFLGEYDVYLYGRKNIVDGERALVLGRENDVQRMRNEGNSYTAITGDRNIIRNQGNGITISGSDNRINYYKEAVWEPGDITNNKITVEQDFSGRNDPGLHIYGARNTVGLDLDNRNVTSSFVVGENNRIYSYDSYVFGAYNTVYSPYGGATAVGRSNMIGIDANTPLEGYAPLAFGISNKVQAGYGTAMGSSNIVAVKYGTALGQYNEVLNAGNEKEKNPPSMSVAMGYLNTTSRSTSVAIGIKNNTNGRTSVLNGKSSTAVGVQNVAEGERSTSLGTFNTTHGVNTAALGAYNEVSGENSIAIGSFNNWHNLSGSWNKYVSGESSIALGAYNTNTGNYSNAIGYKNTAAGQYNTVFGVLNSSNVIKGTLVGYQNYGMGYGSIVMGNQNNFIFSDPFTMSGVVMDSSNQPVSTGILSTTMGVANLMLADNGGTYGYGNQISGSRSYAFGATNINTGIDSFIMGHDSTIASAQLSHYQPNAQQNIRDAMVVGNHSLANISDSVALGAYAITSRDYGMRGYDPTTGADMTDDALFTGTMTKEAYNQAKTDLAGLRTTWEGEVDKLHELRLKIQSQQYSSQDEYNALRTEYDNQENVEMEARKAYLGKKMEMGKAAGTWEGQLAALSIGNEEEGLTRQITGVAAGTNDTDAVNVAQLKRLADMVDGKVTDIDDKIKNVKPVKVINGTNTTVTEGKDGDTTTYAVNVDLSGYAKADGSNITNIDQWKQKLGITDVAPVAAGPISYKADGDADKKTVSLEDGFVFKGDDNVKASTGDNGEVKYTLAKDLTGMNSIGGHDGKLSFTDDGVTLSHEKDGASSSVSVGKEISFKAGDTTVKVTDKGLDAGGKRISHVADGVAMDDAATVGQLKDSEAGIHQEIGRVEHHLKKDIADVGALSAAMSALKPLGYDPYEKTQIMVGVGGYKGSQGVALGVAHHENEDRMYHGGLAYSGNGLMWNAGISIRLGNRGDRREYILRNAPEPVKTEMAKLYDEVDELKAANKELEKKVEWLMEQMGK